MNGRDLSTTEVRTAHRRRSSSDSATRSPCAVEQMESDRPEASVEAYGNLGDSETQRSVQFESQRFPIESTPGVELL